MWILNIFVGHGKNYVNKERSILDRNICYFNLFSLSGSDGTLSIFVLQLAQRDTPIHQWNLPSLPKEFSLFIKRDDMTGSTLSGNKVHSLEFSS